MCSLDIYGPTMLLPNLSVWTSNLANCSSAILYISVRLNVVNVCSTDTCGVSRHLLSISRIGFLELEQ